MNKVGKTIVILSTLDTKGAETKYLQEQIEKQGCEVLVIDLGTRGTASVPADISREEVLAAAGPAFDPEALAKNRPRLIQAMISGAAKKLKELHSLNKLSGVIGVGGATNTMMCTEAMKTLPFGIPKLAISSNASARGFASRYFGASDIAIMHSVIDFTSLNDLMCDILDRAAGSIVGMVNRKKTDVALENAESKGKPRVAMTMLNMCEKCAEYIKQHLEAEGYQIIGFSATGVPDMAMEALIEREGIFSAVIDLAPGAVGEELLGGTRAAGPYRLEAAGKTGIPQIIAPCLVNLMTPPKSKYKPEYQQRKKYDLDAFRSYLRLSPEEFGIVAEAFARKLNQAKGPVKIIVPTKGWSGIDSEGTVLYDPQEDYIFVEALKKHLREDIEIIEVESNLEEAPFAEAVLKAFREVMSKAS